MNRGSRERVMGESVRSVRFNEAPIHESGKFRFRARKSPIFSSFNEAPIHESGKSGHSRAGLRDVLCFNEAPIHESGKSCSIGRI